MKILTGNQIGGADRATIENEPIESINLMERAAEAIALWICNNVEQDKTLLFFIGRGNNGGDGLAVARMLCRAGYECAAIVPFVPKEMSQECAFNLRRLPDEVAVLTHIDGDLAGNVVIIDALLGTGMTDRPLEEPVKLLIEVINRSNSRVISLDTPSGMLSEFGNAGRLIVNAETTLALQFPKLAQMFPEAGNCCGKLEIIDIELNERYIEATESPYQYLTSELFENIVPVRNKFGHKGDYGHTLVITGKEGMMGAAILATSAALRSGCGLVTAHVPREERSAMHASCPSAILSLDPAQEFSTTPALDKYNAIAVGCGIGDSPATKTALEQLFRAAKCPMVIDADALNIIAASPEMFEFVPPQSILTPHPGELKRLVGEWRDEQHKIDLVRELAKNRDCVVVVKGAHTMICSNDGSIDFNSTGTPAMAKGGSGDILTGLIAGLIARGCYTAADATRLGVYLHGLAGELAAEYYGVEAMCSSDMVDFLAEAMKELE